MPEKSFHYFNVRSAVFAVVNKEHEEEMSIDGLQCNRTLRVGGDEGRYDICEIFYAHSYPIITNSLGMIWK